MLKVFLVEDEIIMREGIKNNIPWEDEGFKFVGEASDGELAYPMIRKLQPDILITDIRMPFMDGLELSTIVKQEMPHIKIIILSGYNEFEYAKRAITIGVTDYLLKPISSIKLLEAVRQVAETIEKEQAEKNLIEQYQREMLENVQVERQKFFNDLISKSMGMTEILKKGEKLEMELSAGAYNILLFKILLLENNDIYSEPQVRASEEIEQFGDRQNDLIMFRREADEWIFLIKGGDLEETDLIVSHCCKALKDIMENYRSIGYFGGIGKSVKRLRDLRISYMEASKAFSFRFFTNINQIIQYDDTNGMLAYPSSEIDLKSIDTGKIDRKVINSFLKNGTLEEIDTFIEEYFINLGNESVQSLLLRQYLVMDIYFCAVGFAEDLGYNGDDISKKCGNLKDITAIVANVDSSKEYITKLFDEVINMRDAISTQKNEDVLRRAQVYIKNNYHHEEISLNTVSASVNISPSYFSSVFRKEMGQTFIEYLTQVRMEKAKELLMCSNMKTSEVGNAVGYKDGHYFSYIFKKTQGCTPKEYRMRGKEE